MPPAGVRLHFWSGSSLYRYVEGTYKEFPPLARRWLIMEQVHHDGVHQGVRAMKEKLSAEYFWPTLE